MEGTKEELLKKILEDLGKLYPIGLYEYLYKHRPELYKELLHLEDRVDKAYLSGSVEDLKSVLRDYWTFHMTAIKEFKNTAQLAFNLSDARQEMRDERIKA